MTSPFIFRTGLLLVLPFLLLGDDNGLFLVESFTQRIGRRGIAKSVTSKHACFRICHSTTPVIATSRAQTILFQQRQQSRRWNGNYKHASQKLSDVPKKKKLMIDLTANGVTKTLEKKRMETLQHVLTKAIIWKMFMEDYPNMDIERDIGDPDYLPDVVGTATPLNVETSIQNTEIIFWGESGRMKVHKALDLMRRYPKAHIVHCRWGIELEKFMAPFIEYLEAELIHEDTSWWEGKFSFAALPLEVWKFIDEETETILIEKSDLAWIELDLSQLNFNVTDFAQDTTNETGP